MYVFTFFRPNQDECPGYEYYNAMSTNRWQDDKGKGSPSPSPWPCKILLTFTIELFKFKIQVFSKIVLTRMCPMAGVIPKVYPTPK